MNDMPMRKSNRLVGYDYSSTGYYFVTISVKDRQEILGKLVAATIPGHPYMELSELGKNVDSAIRYYIEHKLAVIDKYVIMPNHIHMINVIKPETGDRGRSPLQHIVRNLKSYITKNIGFSPWQKSFHDHIIRNEIEYQKIWQYIDENPITWSEDYYNGDLAYSKNQHRNDEVNDVRKSYERHY